MSIAPENRSRSLDLSSPSSEIIITCECGKERRAPADALGSEGRCSLCGRVFIATAENSVPAPVMGPLATPDAAKSASFATAAVPNRIASLDQLRGYAILGMFLVNYLGSFHAMPWLLEHQRDCFSYADTIAPLFLFVVGMGFRLSVKRRAEKAGVVDARWHAVKRYAVLFLVAIAFYGPDFRKDWWDALTEIALAGLLTLVLIDKAVPVRALAAFGFLGAFTAIFYTTGYGEWLHDKSMNGGPLGTFGAAFILLFGSVAYDLLESRDSSKIVKWSLIWGGGLVALSFVAWAVFPRDFYTYNELGAWWPYSKRWSTAPFVLVSTGIAFLTFLLFYYLVDMKNFSFSHLSLFGENPLVIYLIQYSLLEIHGVYLPEGMTRATGLGPAAMALLGFAVFYAFMYAIAWRLHKDKIIIKL